MESALVLFSKLGSNVLHYALCVCVRAISVHVGVF